MSTANYRRNGDLLDKAPGLIIYETPAIPYVAYQLKICENCGRQSMRPVGSLGTVCPPCKKKIDDEIRREQERLAAIRQMKWH